MLIRIFAIAAAAAAPAMAQEPAVPGKTVDWSGAYGGLTLGVITSEGTAERTGAGGEIIERDIRNGLFPAERSASEPGALAGVALGYNIQRGAFVTGVELDWSGPGLEVENGYSRRDPASHLVFGEGNENLLTESGYRTDFNGLVTARLRAGYAFGETLVYATGGVAASQVDNRLSVDLNEVGYSLPGGTVSEARYGYVVGAGVERKISDRLSLKAEVMHFDLADATVEGRDPEALPGQSLDYTFDNSGTLARIGLNFAF